MVASSVNGGSKSTTITVGGTSDTWTLTNESFIPDGSKLFTVTRTTTFESWTVPSFVTKVSVCVQGCGGDGYSSSGWGVGGAGGGKAFTNEIPVTPGEILFVYWDSEIVQVSRSDDTVLVKAPHGRHGINGGIAQRPTDAGWFVGQVKVAGGDGGVGSFTSFGVNGGGGGAAGWDQYFTGGSDSGQAGWGTAQTMPTASASGGYGGVMGFYSNPNVSTRCGGGGGGTRWPVSYSHAAQGTAHGTGGVGGSGGSNGGTSTQTTGGNGGLYGGGGGGGNDVAGTKKSSGANGFVLFIHGQSRWFPDQLPPGV
jgi:hypothetical protein